MHQTLVTSATRCAIHSGHRIIPCELNGAVHVQASNILIHKQGFVQLADLGVASMQHRLVSHRSLQGGRPSLEALQALVAQQDGGQPACPLENAAKVTAWR